MNISEITKIILHLNLIKGLGPVVISKITNEYKSQGDNFLKKIYNLNLESFKSYGLSENLSKIIFEGLKNFSTLDEELKFLEKNKNYYIISPYDSNYPCSLKSLETYPPVLYIESKKNPDLNNYVFFSCIGSRKSNFYSEKAYGFFLEKIAREKICIVSGGAIGGDSIAHSIALKNNLKTISILGSGLEKKYPKENLKLFEKIIENDGYIISQFKFNEEPSKFSFPQRNMIIAGFSKSLFVSQASRKSGTLITAQAALDFGRNVGVLPGRFDDELSSGCNYLIKEGASLIQTEDDLFELLKIKKNYNELFKNFNLENSSIENKILDFCSSGKRFENIYLSFKDFFKNEQDLKKFLFDLQIKKLIEEDFMGFWKKVF